MERLAILVDRLYKSVAPTKYVFKVPLVGRFMPLVGHGARCYNGRLRGSAPGGGGHPSFFGQLYITLVKLHTQNERQIGKYYI